MMDGINSIFVVPVLLLLLGATIFIHEFGHYLAARLLGFVVEVFSIGFGPALWKKTYNGTVYKIGCIPFGGYVALPQLDPTGMATIQTDAGSDAKDGAKGEPVAEKKYPPVAPWKKIVVSLAGATGNILLAVVIAWVVYLVGMPAGPAERSPVIGFVAHDCKAYEAGLRTGDEILVANGVEIKNWRAFLMEAALHNEVVIRARSAADRSEKTLTVPTEKGLFGEQTISGVRGLGLCNVLSVEPGMSADKAGIVGGDTIVEFAGSTVYSMDSFVEQVNAHKDEAVPLKVMRLIDGKRVLKSMVVTPAYDKVTDRVRIGITWNLVAIDMDTVIKPLPSEQLKEHAGSIFKFLKALTTPKQAKAAAGGVGGPVAIMISYWYIVKASLMLAIWFTGLLNVNLAILNLLPIPVLDGGHIVFCLWEMIARKPLSPRIINGLVQTFLVLFIAFALFITFRDVDRMTPARKLIMKLTGHGNVTETNALKAVAAPASAPAVTNK